jgi:phosphoglycerate dehydrogenase-like enzyme
MKIKVLDFLTTQGINYVEASPYLDFTGVDRETEVLYLHFRKFDKFDLKFYPKLRYIICPCTNVSNISVGPEIKVIHLTDKEYLFKHVWSTAEHTVHLMQALVKKANRELRHSVVGFLGYGRVAKQVMHLLKGYEIAYYTYDKDSTQEDLFYLFENCDILTIHLEENEETKGLINGDCFSKCRKQPIIINTARSSILPAADLIHAYNIGLIKGFGLDVSETYTKKELLELNSLGMGLITDHRAGKSEASRVSTDMFVLRELERLIKKAEEEGLNGRVNTGCLR